ncbi:MAG TPA: tetratricopeptide repeat protein, partial [Thermomicrobiales bacterium]|nr:tetratricopeptide repeat protein [Thermomicrobiales bacterium]
MARLNCTESGYTCDVKHLFAPPKDETAVHPDLLDAAPSAASDQPDDHCPAALLPSIPARQALGLPRALQWRLLGWCKTVGRFEDAMALLDTIDAEGKTPVRVLEERALLALQLGDGERARALLRQRLDERPSVSAALSLARLSLELGDLDAARAVIQPHLDVDGHLASVAAFVADLKRATGDLAGARAAYVAMLAESPGRSAAVGLARIELREGRPEQAIALAEQVLAEEPASLPATLHRLAAIFDLCDRPTRAADLRDRALREEYRALV